jgi:hypothetical protein
VHRDPRAELPRDPDTLRPLAVPFGTSGPQHTSPPSSAASTARSIAWVGAMAAALTIAFVCGGALVRAMPGNGRAPAAGTMALEAPPATVLTAVPVAAMTSGPPATAPAPTTATIEVDTVTPAAPAAAPAEEAADTTDAPKARKTRKVRRAAPRTPVAPAAPPPATEATPRKQPPAAKGNDAAKQKAIDTLLRASAETPVGG